MLRYEDTLRTVYEFKIPVQGLGVDALSDGMAMANGATGGGPWCEFDEYNGGIHKGFADQSMSFALAFTTSSLYMGTNTIDDTHQNQGSGWNGDTLQIAFTNAALHAA